MIKPVLDYLWCEEVKPDTGVVTTADIADTYQTYKVLAVGPGRWEYTRFVKPEVESGDIIYVQKHAEADTPPELEKLTPKQALIMASRVMGVVDGK